MGSDNPGAMIDAPLTDRERAVSLNCVAELRWSALACCAIGILMWLGPYLWRPDLFSEDAAQHVFWFWRFVDAEAFAGDASAEYFSSPSVAPWGYRVLYALLVPILHPQAAAEWVAVGLLAASAAFAWKLGAALASDRREMRGLLAVVAMLLLVAFPASDLFTPMGLQRTFALPITLMAAWALVERRYGWVGAAWMLAALFYPVVLPVLGLAAVLTFELDYARQRHLPAGWWQTAALGAAAIALVLASMEPPRWAGPTVTHAQSLAMPEFGPGGRLNLYPAGAGYWFGDHRYGIGWPAPLLAVFLAAALVTRRFGRAALVPAPLWALAASGCTLWAAAHLTLFYLYLPNRHSRTSVAVFGIVALAAGASVLLERIAASDSRGQSPTQQRRNWIVAAGAPLLVILAMLPTAWQNLRQPIDGDLERAYGFIASLPADTLVAAHPRLADFIPLRSARPVLASDEVALPFMRGYYRYIEPRLDASVRAAYATDWDALLARLAPYGVDVVLSGPPAWQDASLPAPHDAMARRARTAADGRDFILRSPPPEHILFRSGDYFVVRVASAVTDKPR